MRNVENWLQNVLDAAQSMSMLEVTAVLFALAYVLLAVKENVLCWLFAFLSTAIYTVLFWNVSLLMESALNVYYMAMAVYGWQQWTRGGSNGDDQPHALGVQTMSPKQHLLVMAIIMVFSLVSGYLLTEHTAAARPYVDSFTTWASVVTTYLVARKFLQNWLYWIVIDAVSILLYVDRGLHLTALLFVAYVVIAVAGYFKWREHLNNDGRVVAA